ncbi:hypothetical protein R1flu_001212 [Riccia fluitans]|uniref:Reverse transcriptase zinc-binding domain-containing protein n=1 Tax=Riccia fluitans TaxID=41844 RepID=A0ABD1Y5L3_9MARC
MTLLRDDENRELKDEREILENISQYYTNLYAQPAISRTKLQEQESVLTLVDRLVTEEENGRLLEIPEAAELEEVLNPVKSVLIPFALENPPTWIQETGCQILGQEQFITYLGCRFGVESVKKERTKDLTTKIQKALGKWANRFLTWASRVLLLQHVLRAIPVYQFLGQPYTKANAGTDGKWIPIARELKACGFQLNLTQMEALDTFQQWLQSVQIGPQKLENSPSWRWSGAEEKWNGWIQPSKVLHKMFTAEEVTDDLSNKWSEGDFALTWSKRWRKLWEKGGLPQIKLWTWKLLRHAFFMGEQAAKMCVAEDTCCRFKERAETVHHLFYECRLSQRHLHLLQDTTLEYGVSFRVPNGFLETIDEALCTKKRGDPLIYILYSLTNSIWKDRNAFVFHNKQQQTPLYASLEQARIELQGSCNRNCSESCWQQGTSALA